MRPLLVLAALALMAGGCATPEEMYRGNGRVFLGPRYRGEGLYLYNVAPAAMPDAPHLVIADCDAELNVSIAIANGYRSQILLREQDRSNFAIAHTLGYDRDGQTLFRGAGALVGYGFPYHFTYENLRGSHGTVGKEIFVCACGMTSYHQEYRVVFADADPPIPEESEGKRQLVWSAATHHVDIELYLDLEYLVVDRPGWRRASLPIRLRVFRKGAVAAEPPQETVPQRR